MFSFKKFDVKQDKSAMKVGTDAVLIGAWTSLNKNLNSILDIGAGTGILSLMLAQRSDAVTIDAVEIESDAYEECVLNFEQSDWSDRLFCYHSNFEEFVDEMQHEQTYDLIISNPPFHNEYNHNEDNRALARNSNSLPFERLLNGVQNLLANNGFFSVILPSKESLKFIKIASEKKLFVNRMCKVKGNSNSKSKRVMLEFSKQKTDIKEEKLVIENSRHKYTDEYIALTRDFYIKM